MYERYGEKKPLRFSILKYDKPSKIFAIFSLVSKLNSSIHEFRRIYCKCDAVLHPFKTGRWKKINVEANYVVGPVQFNIDWCKSSEMFSTAVLQ